ncbi:uncharacterized protein LOC132630455 [Lycium barbarum]|uniref:uncharacterized protein LOC132630455 n=1 Tax=Lycium barbarum TaxID=112863 RepID=UPI00293E578A|nr:uncharacterized protein LOC132630455 [Lycium barbarum]
MTTKLVLGGLTFNIISVYAPQAGLAKEDKRRFWEELDEVMRGISQTEKLLLGGDFNGHIWTTSGGYDDVHGRKEHLVTYRSVVAKTQIDYLLVTKGGRGVCKDCKVIPSENLATQHKLVVMDLEIKMKKKKRVAYDWPKIRWGSLTDTKAQEMRERLGAMGAWGSSG